MTRVLVLLALACAGCATTNGGGGALGAGDAASPSVALPKYAVAAAPTYLRWTAPRYLATVACEPDTTLARSTQTHHVLRLAGQPPFYRAGCEASVACWDSVRTFGRPDTVARIVAQPGAACSLAVAAGEYRVVAANGAGYGCESRAVVVR